MKPLSTLARLSNLRVTLLRIHYEIILFAVPYLEVISIPGTNCPAMTPAIAFSPRLADSVPHYQEILGFRCRSAPLQF